MEDGVPRTLIVVDGTWRQVLLPRERETERERETTGYEPFNEAHIAVAGVGRGYSLPGMGG